MSESAREKKMTKIEIIEKERDCLAQQVEILEDSLIEMPYLENALRDIEIICQRYFDGDEGQQSALMLIEERLRDHRA